MSNEQVAMSNEQVAISNDETGGAESLRITRRFRLFISVTVRKVEAALPFG
jgi:hypothetical protein